MHAPRTPGSDFVDDWQLIMPLNRLTWCSGLVIAFKSRFERELLCDFDCGMVAGGRTRREVG